MAESAKASEAGTTLRGGRYVLTSVLGEGSQGSTFEAVDKREGRKVAIKRFSVRGAKAWKDVELAEREANVLASVKHPGLPAYVEHFEDDGDLYLVMERIEGESLQMLRKRAPGSGSGRGAMGEKDVARMLREVGGILTYLHGLAPPVVHRDVKPGNVIVGPDGSFSLVDFGAVRDRLKPEGGSTVVGTFGYMAPEQFQGRAKPASDVYALGATALAMLTGEDPEALPHRGLAIDVEQALRGTHVSSSMKRTLATMLEPDPERRASTMSEVVRGLSGSSARDDGRTRSRSEPRDRDRRSSRAPLDDADRAAFFAEEHARRAEEYAARITEKLRRRTEKRRERQARWEARGRGNYRGRRIGWLPLFALSIVLFVARLAVYLATQIILPRLLMVLSLVFGRGLQRVAGHVRDGGRDALDSIRQAQSYVRNGLREATSPEPIAAPIGATDDARVRVEVPAPPRARVGDVPAGYTREEIEAAEDELEGRTDARRPR